MARGWGREKGEGRGMCEMELVLRKKEEETGKRRRDGSGKSE